MRSRLELRLREQAGPFLQKLGPLLLLSATVWRRMLLRTTFIGVTGSLGKTTAKELIANVLAAKGRTFRSYRNQNNTLAVALNILRVRPWHRYAVIEAAGAAPGMLRHSARILRPDVAVVLNLKRTHTTEFASLEAHAAEKGELLKVQRRGAVAVLNADDALVSEMIVPDGVEVLWTGSDRRADFSTSNVSSMWPGRLSFDVLHSGRVSRIQTQLVGAQWIGSAAAAVAVATHLGLSQAEIAAAMARTEPFPARLQPVELPSGAVIIRDDYNASLDATEPSLQVLADATADRKILVVTDISDFGRNRRQRLKYLGKMAARVSDEFVIIGESAAYGARRAVESGMSPSRAHAFQTQKEAAGFLQRELRRGDLVLLKGRTTDHAARIFLSQLGEISCWLDYCPKRMLCDMCWELGPVTSGTKPTRESLPDR